MGCRQTSRRRAWIMRGRGGGQEVGQQGQQGISFLGCYRRMAAAMQSTICHKTTWPMPIWSLPCKFLHMHCYLSLMPFLINFSLQQAMHSNEFIALKALIL